jgi:hypothetical protein
VLFGTFAKTPAPHHRQDAADLDLVERAIVEHVHRHASDAAAVKAL